MLVYGVRMMSSISLFINKDRAETSHDFVVEMKLFWQKFWILKLPNKVKNFGQRGMYRKSSHKAGSGVKECYFLRAMCTLQVGCGRLFPCLLWMQYGLATATCPQVLLFLGLHGRFTDLVWALMNFNIQLVPIFLTV